MFPFLLYCFCPQDLLLLIERLCYGAMSFATLPTLWSRYSYSHFIDEEGSERLNSLSQVTQQWISNSGQFDFKACSGAELSNVVVTSHVLLFKLKLSDMN